METPKTRVLPIARTEDIVVNKVGSETLVFDLKIEKAHNLNETISIVWDDCDGNTTFDELSKKLSKKLNTRIEDDFILLALEELEKTDLLKDESMIYRVPSRREVLIKYGLPAVAVPVIMSLVAPSVVHAQSCLGEFGFPCAPVSPTGIPCCPGFVCDPNEGGVCLPAPPMMMP